MQFSGDDKFEVCRGGDCFSRTGMGTPSKCVNPPGASVIRCHKSNFLSVPRVGSIKAAQAFAERSCDWIANQLQKQQSQPARPQVWQHGTAILYRGQTVTLQISPAPSGQCVTFGDQAVRITSTANVHSQVERHLWRMAAQELTKRTLELAALHNVSVHRITVRNQRSRGDPVRARAPFH